MQLSKAFMKQVDGMIIAAGAASRFGGEKPRLRFASGWLIGAVIARVAPQVSNLALNVPAASADGYQARYPDYPLVFDSAAGVGPLAGVIAGLEWLRRIRGSDWLATFPCDTPFLPHDLVAQLMAAARDAPVLAHDGNRLHGVCAVWPLHCLDKLRAGVEDGQLRSLYSAMEALDGSTCHMQADAHAFFNINTPDDLTRAEELARAL
jgi:molybdopterin-guanine dinucleotide biosynthesis protein A